MKRLCFIDSTTITLFSNLVFKSVGRRLKSDKKKEGMKVHSVIHTNQGVPCDVRFTSAATNDSFMLSTSDCHNGEFVALDRAYINYGKFEELTMRGVVYGQQDEENLAYKLL